MRRLINRTLLFGGLMGLLVGCGEVPGEAGSISGTVSAPTGKDISGTRIYACRGDEPGCAMLGNVEITQGGESAPYELSLPLGSYNIYALKESEGEDYVGWYGLAEDRAKPPPLVTPPATEIDIQMIVVADAQRSSLPKTVQELSTKPRD